MTSSTTPTPDASSRRQELLRRLLAEQGLTGGIAQEIPAAADGTPAPLSLAQQTLWLFERTFPDSAAFNVPSVVRLTGALDVNAFERALNATIKRHTVLRATIGTRDRVPVQTVSPYTPRPLPVHDLTRVERPQREERADERVAREIARPFDLATGPLVRMQLIKLDDQEHLFVLTMHHIVGDAWSADLLLREVVAQYAAARDGRPLSLPPLSVQYEDFARWQRDRVGAGELAGQLDYWRERLADPPPVLELPTDRPRPSRPGLRGAQLRFVLDGPAVAGLRQLARAEHTTLYAASLAVFTALAHRYTGVTDLIVGTAVANRAHQQVEPLIGFFVNTLPIRTRIRSTETFRSLLASVRQDVANALSHQDLPFEKLVEELNPERGLTTAPYFQIMFSYRPAPPAGEMAGVRAEHLPVHNGTAKRDLTLHVIEHEDELECVLEYDTDLFDEPTVRRMAGHYRRLVASVAAAPDSALGHLPLLDPRELAELARYNDTDRNFPDASRCLHEVFAEQAARTPDTTAVVLEQDSLTFRELDDRANQLAHKLIALGVGPESAVGVCMPSCTQMLVAILGILKAGGAYVPVDPRDPVRRREQTLADAGAAVLVRTPDPGWAEPPFEVVELDESCTALGGLPSTDPGPRATPANMAYLLYTSGSTGKPKGVAIEHRQLMNYTYAIMHRLGIEGPLSYAMHQPLAVDSVVTMFAPPLCTGGTLHLITRERALDATALGDYLSGHGIDCFKIAPSHLRALQQASPRFADILPRRHLVVGGEASESAWIRDVQELAGESTVYNHYGPTETTVGMMVLAIRDDPHPDNGTVAIGPPIANNRVYVVDRNWELVPPGVPGELCVGGLSVGRGYHARPDLTAAAFVPDPFGAEPGRRLYRSGDIVRYFTDGTMEFLGRRDDQIKIRGFRVELGEVDRVLKEHQDVRDSLVVVREDTPGDKLLVAYLVLSRPEDFDQQRVMAHLRGQLPAHMMPAALVPLDALPLSRHGKVERKALPVPQLGGSSDTALTRPSTELEQVIEAVWQKLLQVDEVGVDQNFFDLGGHSLLVMQLHQELQDTLGTQFPLIELFGVTTVRAQAEFFVQYQRKNTGSLDRGRERGRRQALGPRRRPGQDRTERIGNE